MRDEKAAFTGNVAGIVTGTGVFQVKDGMGCILRTIGQYSGTPFLWDYQLKGGRYQTCLCTGTPASRASSSLETDGVAV